MENSLGSWALFCCPRPQSHPPREWYYISNYTCTIKVRYFKLKKSGHICRAGVTSVSARKTSPFSAQLPWVFHLHSKEVDSALMLVWALSSSVIQLTGEKEEGGEDNASPPHPGWRKPRCVPCVQHENTLSTDPAKTSQQLWGYNTRFILREWQQCT